MTTRKKTTTKTRAKTWPDEVIAKKTPPVKLWKDKPAPPTPTSPMTLEEAGKYLRVTSPTTLRRLMLEEGFPFVRLGDGRLHRTRRDWIDVWMSEKQRKTRADWDAWMAGGQAAAEDERTGPHVPDKVIARDEGPDY